MKIGRTHFAGFGEKKLNPSVAGRLRIIYKNGKKVIVKNRLLLSSGKDIVHQAPIPQDTRIGLTILVKSYDKNVSLQNDNEILGLKSKEH